VTRLNTWQPQMLIAYASMLRLLAGEQLAGRLTIAPRFLFSESEVLTDSIRRLATTAWNRAPCTCRNTGQELKLTQDMLHRNDLWLLSRDHVFCQLNCILVDTGPSFGLGDDDCTLVMSDHAFHEQPLRGRSVCGVNFFHLLFAHQTVFAAMVRRALVVGLVALAWHLVPGVIPPAHDLHLRLLNLPNLFGKVSHLGLHATFGEHHLAHLHRLIVLGHH
jgi:hypothetical protein